MATCSPSYPVSIIHFIMLTVRGGSRSGDVSVSKGRQWKGKK